MAGFRATASTADGSQQIVEHGFHAFFRQYYTLRSWLRRIDPTLSFLQPIADYPVAAVDWPGESFAGLPRRAPLNLIRLVQRSPSMTLEAPFDGRQGGDTTACL